MKRNYFVFLVLAISAIIAAGFWESRKTLPAITPDVQDNEIATSTAATNENDQTPVSNAITTFEECLAAGKEVIGEKPNRRCIVNDDLAYIEIETCETPAGESMNIFEARQIFERGKCSWEGSEKENHLCNQETGAWEIGIIAYRKNCEAFCIINVATKEAEVEWRCD